MTDASEMGIWYVARCIRSAYCPKAHTKAWFFRLGEDRQMRFVSTRIHGIADWLMGVVLVALPWLLRLERGSPEGFIPLALGAAALVVTFFTDHELGVVRRIPMVGHLWVDGLAGALLLASPWLFGFADRVWLPHVALGLTELVAAFITKLHAADRADHASRATARV